MSASMRLVGLYLRARSKRHFATAEAARRMLSKPKTSPLPPRGLGATHSLGYKEFNGFPCWTVERQDRNSARTVIYLHGGAYVNEIFPEHWNLVARIADAGARVVVPLYGLAPQYNYKDAYRLLTEIYRTIMATTHPSRVAIAGDSAGGGLALGFTRSLGEEGLPQPRKLLLISPWLDLSLENPEIRGIARKDPWLAAPGAQECGLAWADGDNPKNPKLSPLLGPMAEVAPMDIYIGTRDILLPDVRGLRRRVSECGQNINLTICPGGVHVYPLTPTPEGRAAAAQIARDLATF